jgi:S1-C subfamily serine protease
VVASGFFFGPEGVALTTTHVMAAASAIVATMKSTMPMRPRTVSKTHLQ